MSPALVLVVSQVEEIAEVVNQGLRRVDDLDETVEAVKRQVEAMRKKLYRDEKGDGEVPVQALENIVGKRPEAVGKEMRTGDPFNG